jgi:hypothetical protein
MYATIRTYVIRDPEEFARRAQEERVPLLDDEEGFVAYYVIDSGNGTMSSVTVYTDQAAAEASAIRVAELHRARFVPLIDQGPEAVSGSVTVHHRSRRST